MTGYQVTELYREIGKTFRSWGAIQVVILKSRTNIEADVQMKLEIAVDGCIDKKEMQKNVKMIWPQISMEILDLNENPNMIDEIVEDGIVI